MSDFIQLKYNGLDYERNNSFSVFLTINSSVLALLNAYYDLGFIDKSELDHYSSEFKKNIAFLEHLKASSDLNVANDMFNNILSLLDSLTSKITLNEDHYIKYAKSKVIIQPTMENGKLFSSNFMIDLFSKYPYFVSLYINNDSNRVLSQHILYIKDTQLLYNRNMNHDLFRVYNELLLFVKRFGNIGDFLYSNSALDYLNRRCAVVYNFFHYVSDIPNAYFVFVRGRSSLFTPTAVNSTLYLTALNSLTYSIYYHYSILMSYLAYSDETFGVRHKIDYMFGGVLNGFDEINSAATE